MFVNTLMILFFAFTVSFWMIRLILGYCAKRPVALDMPDRRKVHSMPVPRIGGLGILAGFLVIMFFIGADREIISLFISSIMIFLVGLFDDLKGLGWRSKMAGTVLSASVPIFYGGISINNLGDIFGTGPIELGWLSVPFTYFCVIGIVNSINMIDGLNGLAGGIAVIMLSTLGYFAYSTGQAEFMYVSLALIGGIIGFMMYNYPKGLIFMGDSGSNLIGFVIAISSIALFKNNLSSEPMVPVVILSLPIFDTIRVMTGRVLRGRSPFYADRSHIHHILTRIGLKSKKIVSTLWLITLVFCAGALILKDAKGWQLLLLLVSNMIVLGVFIEFMVEAKKARRNRKVLAFKGLEKAPCVQVISSARAEVKRLEIRRAGAYFEENEKERTVEG